VYIRYTRTYHKIYIVHVLCMCVCVCVCVCVYVCVCVWLCIQPALQDRCSLVGLFCSLVVGLFCSLVGLFCSFVCVCGCVSSVRQDGGEEDQCQKRPISVSKETYICVSNVRQDGGEEDLLIDGLYCLLSFSEHNRALALENFLFF
jgi:hypothetical protein